jgi:hypothetical protein
LLALNPVQSLTQLRVGTRFRELDKTIAIQRARRGLEENACEFEDLALGDARSGPSPGTTRLKFRQGYA